jgi:hypothetical protein
MNQTLFQIFLDRTLKGARAIVSFIFVGGSRTLVVGQDFGAQRFLLQVWTGRQSSQIL